MGTPLENVSFNEDILNDIFKWVRENSDNYQEKETEGGGKFEYDDTTGTLIGNFSYDDTTGSIETNA